MAVELKLAVANVAESNAKQAKSNILETSQMNLAVLNYFSHCLGMGVSFIYLVS